MGDATALAATEKEVVRPIAIFAILVVVGLIAIEAGLRATRNSASANPFPKPPTPLTHAQFVRAGNRVCDRYYREGSRAVPKHEQKTLKAGTRDLRSLMPLIERDAAGLRALLPPRSDAGSYRRLLSVMGQELYDFHATLHAFETGQIRRGVLIARHADHLDKRFNSRSRKLGLSICGLTGRQVRARYG